MRASSVPMRSLRPGTTVACARRPCRGPCAACCPGRSPNAFSLQTARVRRSSCPPRPAPWPPWFGSGRPTFWPRCNAKVVNLSEYGSGCNLGPRRRNRKKRLHVNGMARAPGRWRRWPRGFPPVPSRPRWAVCCAAAGPGRADGRVIGGPRRRFRWFRTRGREARRAGAQPGLRAESIPGSTARNDPAAGWRTDGQGPWFMPCLRMRQAPGDGGPVRTVPRGAARASAPAGAPRRGTGAPRPARAA